MITKNVTVSGTVGKQVYFVPSATTQNAMSGTHKVTLKGFLLYSPSGLCHVQIRDGHASGGVEFKASTTSGLSLPVLLPDKGRRFDKGMHVKVLGTNAECYLYIN